MYLLRPTPGFAEPPICSLNDLRTVYSLDDLANFHEILDLRQYAGEKAERVIAADRAAAERRQPRRGRR